MKNFSKEKSCIVGLSANSKEMYKDKCLKAGMNDYSKIHDRLIFNVVCKPIELEKLKKIILMNFDLSPSN